MKFENIGVYNIENALRGMRNPMNSHSKSDSFRHEFAPGSTVPSDPNYAFCDRYFDIGPADKDLAMRLIKAGLPHRKFMRQIFVSVDITAPMMWMLELDTYKVGTTMDCSSTMHKLMSRMVVDADFDSTETIEGAATIDLTIRFLNKLRSRYVESKEKGDNDTAEKYFRDMKRNLPASYLYHFTWTANYEVLRNIYEWRHTHRLPHWREFCMEFIEKLPYHELITMPEK